MPRVMAGLAAITLLLLVLAWEAGGGAHRIAPLLLSLYAFHLLDLGWMNGRFGPFAKLSRGFLRIGDYDEEPEDPAPHRFAARIQAPLAALLWLGLAPLPGTARTLLMGVGLVLLTLNGLEAITGTGLLSAWYRRKTGG